MKNCKKTFDLLRSYEKLKHIVTLVLKILIN